MRQKVFRGKAYLCVKYIMTSILDNKSGIPDIHQMINTSVMSETMSYREKTAWACLITTLLVWVPYFAYVIQLLRRHELTGGEILGAFIGAVVVQIVLQIMAGIAIAIRSKQEPKDERDQAIEAKSSRYAYFVLGACVFVAPWVVAPIVMAGEGDFAQLLTPIAISQMVLFCFVVAETVRFAIQVVCYRRGS